MKRKSFKFQKMVAMTLSAIMVVQFTPKELLKVLAEEVSSAIEQLENQKEEIQYSTVLTDGNNIGTSDIIQENVHHRTLTSKEYLMSDDTIMVQQFNKPIHYYVNGEYIEIDKAEKELQAEATTDLSNATTSGNFEFVNVFENTENVTEGLSISAGKINGEEKIDLFLNFKLPSVEPYYQLIGAKIKFEYQTQGASLFDSKDYSYNVYVAESERNLRDITYESKPKKMQELESIQKKSQVSEKILTYESDIINVNNIENGVITLGIESTDATSSEGYISTLSESVETTTFYQIVSGIEDDYSLQTYEIDGATAYINNSTGDLTLNCDLLSIETMSDMPFASSLIYNSNYDALLTEIGKTSIAGYGFKLNFQQFMIQDGAVYYLIDADGSISSFHSLGTGEYYSKEKKLYYTPDVTISGKGTIRDVLDNQMLFENGRLIKIVSGANVSEYIEITYLTNTDKISQVSYYFGATTPKYEMEFEYDSLGRLWKATSGTSSVEYAKSIITYNEEGYLTGISNHTGRADTENGVQRLSLGYLEIYISESKVYLTEIWNNQGDGLTLGYVPGENLTVYRCVGRTMQSGPRELSKNIIYFFGTRTEIISYENNIETGRKNIAFNNKQKVISEWVKDNSGIVSVSNRTNWSNSEDEVNNYVEGYCSYVQKYNNTDFVYVGANQQKTIKFSSPFESEEKTDAYTFAFSFRVVGHYGLDFTVTIGSSAPVKIKTENAVETYISIPYQRFVGEINLTIKNNDTNSENTLSINDFNYSIVNYTEEKYTYASGIKAHKLESTEANLKNAFNVKTTYDAQQRIQTAVTQNITDAATFETTTYEYIDSGIWKGNVESVVTKDKDNNNTEIVEYTYSGNKEAYSVTQNITKGDLRQYTIQQKESIGEDGIKFTYTDENGEQSKEYYALLNGDIRLQKVEYDNLYEQYAYNDLGQVTSINVYNASTNTVMYSQTDNYTENGVYIGSSYNGNDFTYTYGNGLVSSIGYKPTT